MNLLCVWITNICPNVTRTTYTTFFGSQTFAPMLPVPLTQRFFFVCACPCRRFAIKRCSRCQLGISANELVMRARDQVFHLSCFACSACNRTLTPGEEFGLRDNLIYCRTDYELIFQGDYIPSLSPGMGHPGHSPNPNGSIPFYNLSLIHI